MQVLNCVIVVEGKTDTALLKQLFVVDTIETNGSALTNQTINLIQLITQHQPVILALDPDYQGRLLMHRLKQHLSNCYLLLLTSDDLRKGAKKTGLAECQPIILRQKILNLLKMTGNQPVPKQSLTWKQYLELALNTKTKRLQICCQLQIPYFNHKQLFKILSNLFYTQEQIKQLQHG